MNFTINRKQLISILGNCLKAISNTTPNELMKCLKIMVKENRVVFFASGSSNSIPMTIVETIKTEIKIEEKGTFLVDAKFLDSAVKKMTGDTVKFEIKEDDTSLKIQSGKAKFKMACYDLSKYPRVAIVPKEEEKRLTIRADILKDGLDGTVFATFSSTITMIGRGILQCIKMSIRGESVNFVATDSYRLAQKTFKTGHNDKQADIMIANTAAKSLIDIMLVPALKEDKNAVIEIYSNDKSVAFTYKNLFLQVNFVEGSYPQVDRIFQKVINNVQYLKTNRKDLIDTINRSALFIEDKTQLSRIEMAEGKVKVTSKRQEVGDFEEEIECTYNFGDSPTYKVILNSNYLLQALKAVKNDEVTIVVSPMKEGATLSLDPMFILEEDDKCKTIQLFLPIKSYD